MSAILQIDDNKSQRDENVVGILIFKISAILNQ